MSPDFKRETTKISDGLNFMNILFDVRIGDQFDLSVIESNPGKSNRRCDIRVLGIFSRSIASRAFKMNFGTSD